MKWHHRRRPGSAVSRQTAAQSRYSLGHIAIFGPDPTPIDSSKRTPEGETQLARDCNQLVRPLIHGCVVSDVRKQHGAECQAHSQGRRMSQSLTLSNCCIAPRQRPVRKAEAEKDIPQVRL